MGLDLARFSEGWRRIRNAPIVCATSDLGMCKSNAAYFALPTLVFGAR